MTAATATQRTDTAALTAALPIVGKGIERAVARAFKAANRAHQEARGDLYGLSMSGLGGCTRQAAYRLAGTDPSDPGLPVDQEARQAMIGTWIHAGFLPALQGLLHQAETEFPVTLTIPADDSAGAPAITIPGTPDCYTAALNGGVIDLKTIYAYSLPGISREGTREAHRKQVRGYACALRLQGRPVHWICWLYMDRSTGEVLAAIEPYGDQEHSQTIRHIRHLWRLAQNPEQAPRTKRGPGLDPECDSCAWLKACWGPEAEAGDSSALQVHTNAEVAEAAAEYIEVRKQIAELNKRKDVLGAMIGRPEQGTYGEVSITYTAAAEKTDTAAAALLLEQRGIEVPKKLQRGNRLINWA